MNILYFVNRFPKLSESFVINEIKELEERGHQIAVFSLLRPEIDLNHEEVNELDVDVGYLPKPSLSSAIGTPGRWCLDWNVIRSAIHAARPLQHAGAAYIAGHCIEFVQSLDYDLDHVHGHFLNWPKLAASYTAAHFDVPLTTTAHAYGLYSSPDKRLLRLLSDRMNHVVTISEYNRRYLKEDIEVSSPVDVVHMGIDPEKFEPTESTISNRIVTVARFEEKKGILDGLDAISGIQGKIPDLEYHLIGSGEQEELIRKRIDSLGLNDTVSLLGHISDERLIRELDEAEVFLLPCVIASDGDRDGIPVALMEAMAMKTVPISTTISGIPELIDHQETGLLVEPGDVASLSETLLGYLNGEPGYDVSRSAARQRVEESFDIRKTVDELDAVIQSINR